MKHLCAVAFVVLGSSLIAKAQSGDTAKELTALEQSFNEALLSADWKTVERIHANDLVFTNADGSVTHKADLVDGIRSGDMKFESIEMSDVKVQALGNVAAVTGRVVERGRYKTDDLSGTYRFTDVWAKRDGRWQIVTGQETRYGPTESTSTSRASSAVLNGQQAPQSKIAPSTVEAELVSLAKAWTDAINAKDRSKLDELMAPEFTLHAWDNSWQVPKAQWMKNLLDQYDIKEYQHSAIVPHVYDDGAMIASNWYWRGDRGATKKEPFEEHGYVVDVWRHKSGHWQVVSRITIILPGKGESAPDATGM